MSIVGTQRIPGTRCLVWVTRASRALTGSLRMDWGVRPRASYVRQSPVRPSQQPTLKRHRGHWNVPWRHSIAAAQRGQGSTAGSGAVSAGGEAAIRRRYAARRTAVEAWVPRTPSGHPRARAGRTPGDPALRSPVPTSGSRATRASVPGVDTREPRRSRVSPFSYRSRRRRADPREGWCCWRGRRLPHQDWTPTHLGTGRCSAPVFRNVPRWLRRPMICVHLSDLTEKALLVPSKRGSTR